MLFLPEDPPSNSPIHKLHHSSCRPHRAPASPPFPPADAPQTALPPDSSSASVAPLGASQGPEQPAYSSLPHLSPVAPWGLAISWISGRPAPGTMSGDQEDPEGSDHNMGLEEGNNTTRIKRGKATNWPRVMSKFLLDWYLEKKRGMSPTSWPTSDTPNFVSSSSSRC